jgi:uroporphyrin-3 C-methyltransferase
MADDKDKLSVQLNEAFERLEKRQQENEIADTQPAKESKIETESRSNPVNVLGTVLALISIGVASYAAFVVYTNMGTDTRKTIDEITGKLGALERELQTSQAEVTDLRGKLDSVTSELAQMDTVDATTLETFQARVDETVAAIRHEAGTSSQDWLFAEVEYLLRLGNQRVMMEGDAKRAAALFRAADEIIRDAEGIAAFNLRLAIANDIAALDAVAEVDVDGIFVRLTALVNQVANLKQRELEYRPLAEPVQAEAATSTFGNRLMALAERGAARLASLIDFRRGQERIEPILPPEEEYYLRQNLIMKLQMAQLGLLRGDQTVYADSLTEAQSWIVGNFDPDDAATTALLTSLEALEAIRIDKDLPDVTASLREVRKLMTDFHEVPDRKAPERSESEE